MEEFDSFEESYEETQEFSDNVIREAMSKNAKDWASAAAWGGFVLDNYDDQRQHPENSVPSNAEALIIEFGKTQYILMEILKELRKG